MQNNECMCWNVKDKTWVTANVRWWICFCVSVTTAQLLNESMKEQRDLKKHKFKNRTEKSLSEWLKHLSDVIADSILIGPSSSDSSLSLLESSSSKVSPEPEAAKILLPRRLVVRPPAPNLGTGQSSHLFFLVYFVPPDSYVVVRVSTVVVLANMFVLVPLWLLLWPVLALSSRNCLCHCSFARFVIILTHSLTTWRKASLQIF